MTRIHALRDRLGWSQRDMSKYLGTSQPTVHRLENGQREPGPIARLLDSLEATLPTSVPPSGGSTFCPPDTSSPPAEPQSDRANGEDLSSAAAAASFERFHVRAEAVGVAVEGRPDGSVVLSRPGPASEPEDAA